MREVVDILAELASRFNTLLAAKPNDLARLTEGALNRITGGAQDGVYLFSRRDGAEHLYVGRTRRLPERIGVDHRSLDKSMANVTNGIMQERGVGATEAQAWLFENCVVRLILEPDPAWRALLEAYTALALGTKYNDFTEKGAARKGG